MTKKRRAWKTLSQNASRANGFTIVELLIVIVVIGILATITVVAYNGIQNSARNAKMVSAVDAYQKALAQYKILNGRYPSTRVSRSTEHAALTYTVGVCLGNSPAASGFNEGLCFTNRYDDEAESYPAADALVKEKTDFVNDALSELISPLPDVSDISIDVDSTPYSRGITYFGHAGDVDLQYYVKGEQNCARGEPTYIPEYDITYCTLTLN